jgi:hypothetical protein
MISKTIRLLQILRVKALEDVKSVEMMVSTLAK